MARARNIKPSFFNNDELAENDPLGRLLFIGLWTIADFKGDIIWREKRIKAQILPYDNCDLKKLAINLDKSGFIRFYSDQDNIYINIVNFGKHQNPHKNEKLGGSLIPPYSESMRQAVDLKGLTIYPDKNGTNPDNDGTNRADSLIPIADSLLPITLPNVKNTIDRFDEFWNMYDKKTGMPKCKAKFAKLSESVIDLIFQNLPSYILSTPDKKYRKNPEVWINNKCWNDEIITSSNNKPAHTFDNQNYTSGKF